MVDKKHQKFTGDLGTYSWVLTEDNSWTLWSGKFDENCHSLSGAREETRHNFIYGCELKTLDNQFGCVHVLEVGFGLGIGFEETLSYWQKCLHGDLIFVSLELDKKLVELSVGEKWDYLKLPLPHFSYSRNHQGRTFKSIILIGDGRETLPEARKKGLIPEIFHAIYQDPFSPKKNTSLWSKEWFGELLIRSHKSVILSTYSASYSVRKSMLEAGWSIENRKGYKHKKSNTRAFHPESTDHSGDKALMEEVTRAILSAIKD